MPKKQKMEEYLRFGQIVRIHGNKCLQEERDGDVMGGMITVKGFTDKDAKYTTFEEFKDCQFYRQSLFQILPKGAFEAGDNKNEALKEKLANQYIQTIKKKMGQHVVFGQDVVFKHVDSHDFLSGSVRCSDGGLGAFRVQLSQQLTTDLVFKLQPFRSFNKQGDYIKLQSPLRIKNISNRCYISTQSKQGKHNIVTTYSRNFTWLIHLHEEHDTLDDIEQIRTHDLLFLIHTKNQGFLTLEKPGEPCIKLPRYLTGLPFYTSLWEIQKYSIPTISPYSANQKTGTEGTYSLRQLLNNDYLEVATLIDQNFMQEFDPHQICISSATSSKGSSTAQQDLKDKGLIKIEGPKSLKEGEIDAKLEQKPLQKLVYRKVSPFTCHAIEVITADSENAFRVMKIDEESKSQVLFILSTFQVLNKFNQGLNNPIEQIQGTMKTDELLHIDQTLRKLVGFIKDIKDCSQQSIKAQLLPIRKIQYICMQLKICDILFSILSQIGNKILQQIYKRQKQKNNALKTVFNQAYYFIWQIIKGNSITKLYVCQDWIDIILDHAIQLEQDTVHDCLNQILQNNDDVVTKFLERDNNKLVQRIINIFALKPPHEKFLKIFSASCISGNFPIVDNQNLILTEFLKKLDETSKFILQYDLVHQNQDVGPESLPIEQKPKIKTVYVYCYMSKDLPSTRRLKKFFDESERIDLHQTSNYFISYLNLLADICYGKNTEAKKYVEYILQPRLIQDGLNLGEENQMRQVSILDYLVAILEDNQMKQEKTSGSINLQRAALRLITYAYIQSADLSPVIRINRYRNLDQMNIQDREDSQINFGNIMQFIKSQISLFKSFYSDNIEGKDRDKISLQIKMRLFTILNLLKSTLINGMWTIEQQQNQILPLLSRILRNNKADILENKEDSNFVTNQQLLDQFQSFQKCVSMPTPSVQRIIECKALTCQLMEIITDFRFNSLVSESAKFYKDLEEEKDDNIKTLHKISLNIAQLKSDAKSKILYNPDLWQQKLNTILKKNDVQSEQLKQANAFLVPLMVQLSIHRNSRLFFRSLTILKRSFHMTIDIKHSLLSLSLFDNKNGNYLVSQIMQKRKQFNKLQEESLLYAPDIVNSPYANISDFLAWLSQSLKIGTNLDKEVEANNYFSIFQHFTQESRIDKFHQRLIKNTDLHPLLIKFLGLSKQPLQKFNHHAKKVLKYVYRFLTLLARNFKEAKNEMMMIVETVRKHTFEQGEAIINKKSQDLRSQLRPAHFQLGILITMDDKAKMRERGDCEAILFLNELFTDNKDILYNQNLMQQIASQMSELVDKIPIEDYYKSHVLDFLRSVIYFKDKHIVINQGRILAKLQDSKKHDIYYRFDPQSLERQLNLDIKKLVQEWEYQNDQLQSISRPGQKWPVSRGEQEVVIVPQLTYFITIMNLFSNLVQGKQIVNIGKCRQVHSYSMLMDILKNAGLCYPLKAHLKNYINQLYYSTQIEQDLCVQIITLQIPLLIKDLNLLIIILSKQRKGRYKILHPTRYKYFQSYIYLYIEQIAYSINYLLSDQIFLSELKKQLDTNYGMYQYQLHYYLIRVYERLRWILNYYYGHKYIRGFLNKITNKMHLVFLLYFKDIHTSVFDKSQEKLHDPQYPIQFEGERKKKAMSQNRMKALKKRSKKLLGKLVQAEIGNYFTQPRPEKDKNFPLTFFLPYDEDDQPVQLKQAGTQKSQNQRKVAEKLKMMIFSQDKGNKRVDHHSRKLTKLREELDKSQNFVAFMKSFIESSSVELFDVSGFFREYYKFKVDFISFKQYIRIFVDVNTNSPTAITTDLKIFFFDTLLEFITKHNPSHKLKPIQKWNKNDLNSDSYKQVKQAQHFLAESNVAELIIQTLSIATDLPLISSILQFGIAFTLGGNTICQNSILQKVKEDQKNQLFLKIQDIISKLGKKISSRIAEIIFNIQPRSDEFVVQSIDRYDFYDQPTRSLRRFGVFDQERDQIEEEILEVRVFGCLFRFMQLLCECNNIEFKHFIRQQSNVDGSKKASSINILNMTTFQIRRLFKVMSKDASVIILPLTDFLNEVVSLPCQQNQIALCDTTFFEDLCYMATFFEDEKNLKEFRLDNRDSLQRLFHLYQCCILIILNILEGNTNQLTQAFLIKLQVKFLLKVIKENFLRLKIEGLEDLKKFFEDKSILTKHVPTDIQNAINVMIVLLKLQTSEGSEAFRQKKKMALMQIQQKTKYPLKELMEYLEGKILKIQISSTLGRQYIYFPQHPILTKLSHPTRNRIMLEVSRSTQRQKIKSLLKFKIEIQTEITHNFDIEKQKYHGMEISTDQTQKLQSYMFNLSYIIILMWFLTTDVIVEFQEVDFMTPKMVSPFLTGLNLVQLGLTSLYTFLYYKIQFQLANYRSQKKSQEQKEEAKRQSRFAVKEGQDQPQQKQPSKLSKIFGGISDKINSNSIVIMLKFDQNFFTVLLYLFASVTGTFFDQKMFLLYILYYFMLNQNLENVFKAITFNLNSLFSVGLLGLVFVYIFCLILYDTYALDSAAKSQCYTIYGCILDLYASGSIGGSVEQLQPMRFSTDLIFFIFFDLLFSNIVSGIMIDTFAALRTKRQQMALDKSDKCYICGRSRADLQRNNEKFEDHIKLKHFLWNYIYYIHCLYNKNQTQYSGLEYEIRVCLDKGENEEDYISWIPFKSSDENEDAEKAQELIYLMDTLNITTKNYIASKGTQQAVAET